MIPHSIIEDLKYRCPVEDVIASYVPLKKAGSNLKGLCPFHSEKTPSFTVFTQSQSFYCFGCGAGGDVVSFIMRAENLDYVSALEFLANRCGITLPDERNDFRQTGTTRTRILAMNLEAAKFFRNELFESAEGEAAREYVRQRQLSGTTVKHFGLGYSPNSFNALRNHLSCAGYTDEEMADAFLCRHSERTGKYFDLFRGRLMFPIIDNSGNIIAFGGRVLDDSKPKYLNTSDTAAFKKSKNLFALNFARTHCSEQLIVCEGYMDVIAMHAAGFENSVATLGTAITPEHARMLKKYTKKVILSYDSDSAGQNATDKALRLLSEVGLDAGILVMKGAKDPDEYIKKFGKEKFRELLGESRTRFDYKVENVLKEYDISNDAQKIKATEELCRYIAGIPSKVEREIYTDNAAKILGVSVKSINADTDRIIKRNVRNGNLERRENLMREKRGFSDLVNRDYVKFPRLAKLEETVLGMVLLMKEYLTYAVDGKALSEDDFSSEYTKKLFSFVKYAEENGGFDIAMLSESFSEGEVSKASGLMAERMKLSDNNPAVFEDTVQSMRAERDRMSHSGEGGIDVINEILKAKKNN